MNRKVNCEAANLNKTANASLEQVRDIEYISEYYGLESLPENLRQAARLRLEKPDASLTELGKMMDPPVSKSGVNHRFKKLKALADQMRETKTITVEIPAGLEVRPVAVLVQVANQYNSSIYVESGNKKVNAKSIMGLMTLGLRAGESVTVHADGSDEEDAVAKIEAYLTGRAIINARA